MNTENVPVVAPEPITTNQDTALSPRDTHLPFIVMVMIISLIISTIAVFLFWQNQQLRSQLISTQSSPAPIVAIPLASADPTAGWKTYTNQKYKFSFRYPGNYQIKTSNEYAGATPYFVEVYSDDKFQRILVTFNFDQAKDGVLIDAHGDQITKNPVEKPTLTIGSTTYPASKYFFAEGTPGVGECINTTASSRYIAEVNNSAISLNILESFVCDSQGNQDSSGTTTQEEITQADLILSTFKFTDQIQQNNPLTTLKELTQPMVWSEPLKGELYSTAQSPVSGTLITTPVLEKGIDKLMPLLGTESILTTNYGWEADMDGFADGVGSSVSTYIYNGKKIIIRTDKGIYKVLLSD